MKILFLRHKYVTLLAGLLLAAGVFLAVTVPAAVSVSAAGRQLPIYCVHRDQKVCAISFDAAWGDASTQSLVDILNRYQVKATFFVIGNWAEQYPDDVKMLHENGMEVMNHSSAHGHMNQMSSEAIIADVNKCNDQIEALTGQRPTLFRCPYGEYDDHVISAIRSAGMEPIQWDVEPPATTEPPAAPTLCRRSGDFPLSFLNILPNRKAALPSGSAALFRLCNICGCSPGADQNFRSKFIRIWATSARVAVALGARPLSVPLITPAPTAQFMADTA